MRGTPGNTAVIYCRTSTRRQREVETIEAQVERCERLVQTHELQPLTSVGRKGWLIDDGVSGTLLAGRDFATLIDDLQNKRVKVDYLVVYSLSRIARRDKASSEMEKLVDSARDNATIKAVLQGAGVKVIDGEGVHDPATLAFDLKLAFADEELKQIRDRTMAGKARRLRAGKYAHGGRVPYGYDLVGDKTKGFEVVKHPEDSKNLQRIFRWFIEGGLSYAASKADDAIIPTPMLAHARRTRPDAPMPKRGQTWDPSTVQFLVRHASMYATGRQTLKFGGKDYKVELPKLLDGQQYEAVRRRQSERTLKKRTVFLGTGYCDCACEAHIFAKNGAGGTRHYTSCSRSCGSIHESEFAIVLWIATVARLLQVEEHERKANGGPDPWGPKLEAAKAKRDDVMAGVARLAKALVAGMNENVWRKENDALNDQLAAAQAEIERLERVRAEHAKQEANAATLEQRLEGLFDELANREPPLDRKREILGDLLAGAPENVPPRVIVSWPKTKSDKPVAKITFPAWGSLPEWSFRTDHARALAEGPLIEPWVAEDSRDIPKRPFALALARLFLKASKARATTQKKGKV